MTGAACLDASDARSTGDRMLRLMRFARSVGTARWLLVITYLGVLSLPGNGFHPWIGTALGVLSEIVPAITCCWAIRDAGARRREICVIALGMSGYALGASFLLIIGTAGRAIPFPSIADIGFTGFYLTAIAAVVLAVRRELRQSYRALWMDGLLGAFGAATVLAVVLGPVVSQASGNRLQITVLVAYPLFDLVLIAVVVGIAALQRLRVRAHWIPLLLGLALFATADVIYALRTSHGTYSVGTPLDGIWAVGMILISMWAQADAPAESDEGDAPAALAVPALATLAGLAVLVTASRTSVSFLAVGLAAVTLIAAAARTQLAFQQLLRVADLRRQAVTDDLTGLPNRRAFYAHTSQSLSPRTGATRALLLLDLDRFKEVNDSLGHQVGDRLLLNVSHRLTQQFRDVDFLARLGGDEFAVLLHDVDRVEALAVAVKVREALSAPFSLEGIAVSLDASIGISLFPEHGEDLGLLLRRADVAMYRSKRAANGPHVYTSSDDTHGETKLRTLQQLRTALGEKQFVLHYQPKVDLSTGGVHGVEALVRWPHPARGLLFPDSFLDLVEEGGLMPRLTHQVLELALDQVSRWSAQGRDLTVAVNLSASSLLNIELPQQVNALLAERNLPANRLQLEITEEFLMDDRVRARDILSRLRSSGVQISIDDFGTGYSSLSYLRELPIDELKLDRSFVFPMADDTRAAALVNSTIALAHSLGLRMVAEGVENGAALSELTRNGCDQAQGYYLCKPVPADELDRWLTRRTETVRPTVGPPRGESATR